MAEEISLSWDGETIKQEVKVETIKLTPKEILDSLDQANGSLDQMEGQKVTLKKNLIQLDNNIKSAKVFIKERNGFKLKCEELQKSKLENLIVKYGKEASKIADKISAETIAKDPKAYTENQKDNMAYVFGVFIWLLIFFKVNINQFRIF